MFSEKRANYGEKLVHKFLSVDFKNLILKIMLLSLKITLQRYVIRLRQKSFEYSLSKPTVKFATF